MPVRAHRPRKTEGLKSYIRMLYERPALKFLKAGEPWEDLADVMFGPNTNWPSQEEIEELKALWLELRADILAAQAQYAPNKKPWGARFDGAQRVNGKGKGESR